MRALFAKYEEKGDGVNGGLNLIKQIDPELFAALESELGRQRQHYRTNSFRKLCQSCCYSSYGYTFDQ